ncbi:MAG: PHP domain-containing protein [Syntrophales bacterium]
MGELRKFFADLHVHTALSPCAGDSATPPHIVASAIENGMQMIAVTDHNSAENVDAVVTCGRRHGLKVIPGLEVASREEVHLVCLLGSVENALALQEIVYAALPEGLNRPDAFGRQSVMDEDGAAKGECLRLLMGTADLSLEEIIHAVHRLEGLVIAAHIDRPSFSVIANLGLVPPGAQFDALEISASLTREEAVWRFPFIAGFPLVTASDAHFPPEIGSSPTLFLLERMDLGEMRMALQGRGGREYLIQ